MVDQRLALQNERSLDTATPITAANREQLNNSKATEDILKSHYETLDAREKSRLSSTIAGAVQLKSFLDNQDLDGAHDFLIKRKQSLMGRIGNGENVDTQETDAALQMLRSGNIEELNNSIGGLMAAGQVYGILDAADAPSNVREWQYYNSLDDAQKEQYLTMKRANSVVNLGGSQVIPSQTNPAGPPKAEMPVTLKPEDQPSNARAKSQAEEEGRSAGESGAAASNTMQKAAGLIAAFEDLKTAAPDSPSGAIAGGVATGANTIGVGGKAAQGQGAFSVKRAAAENEIRAAFRVVGSGGQSDRDAVPFINMLPAETDSNDVKIAKIDAAMQAVRTKVSTLAKERNLPDPFKAETQGNKRVRVSNGQETLEIDEADLPEAQSEGYNPI